MAAIFTLFGKARETTIVSIAMLESEENKANKNPSRSWKRALMHQFEDWKRNVSRLIVSLENLY